jgi:glycosyltransferase involved in cell wall biosynthesis
MGNEMKNPVAAYFDKHAETHKRQFVGSGSGASFYFQKRLILACELAGASTGRLLDGAAGSAEITCALLKSRRFSHATIVDISPAMLQSKSAYEQKLQELAAGPSVVFVGAQFGAEKNACYRACDAFILPSLSEGLPMAVLEAWAHAKPVLMTPECNLPEGFATGAALQIGTTP